jgi:hypothetical protein
MQGRGMETGGGGRGGGVKWEMNRWEAPATCAAAQQGEQDATPLQVATITHQQHTQRTTSRASNTLETGVCYCSFSHSSRA